VELYLMLTGTGDIVRRCDRLEFEVMELVSTVVGGKRYGTTLESIGINVVLQDAGMIKLGTRVFRKRKEAAVDVELSKQWARNASDSEVKLALLQCLVEAISLVGKELIQKGDDFDTQALIADLQPLIADIREKMITETGRISELDVDPRGRRAERREEAERPKYKTLIVQYCTEGWGSPEDLERCHRGENILDEQLRQTDNGYCDGNDIGSGTVNIFLHVLDPYRAMETITETLGKARMLDEATIALEIEEGFQVLWPQDFVGEFSYSY
jgi:hypothetical protein